MRNTQKTHVSSDLKFFIAHSLKPFLKHQDYGFEHFFIISVLNNLIVSMILSVIYS